MHRLSSSFVLGYHGCEEAVAESLLAGEPFQKSSNDYDWLGPGIYFWEANPQRGLEFAVEAIRRKKSAKRPTVVGAVIDLGLCLDLASQGSIEMLEEAYKSLKATMEATGEALPENAPLLRKLDCAVVNRLHSILGTQGQALDSVRGDLSGRLSHISGCGLPQEDACSDRRLQFGLHKRRLPRAR